MKFYCPICHDTCEYMSERSIITFEQPIDEDGIRVAAKHANDEVCTGAVCLLCKGILKYDTYKYKVNIIKYGGREYVDVIDIINIHNAEVCNTETV